MPNDSPIRPYRAIVAGFCASAAAALTFLFAHLGATILARGLGDGSWFAALVQNSLVDLAASSLYLSLLLHFVIGITLAGLYAVVVDRLPNGNHWTSGLWFSLLPWMASGLIFFPLMGAGLFAWGLGAGLLPIAGWLVLHLIYGSLLGFLYSPEASRSVMPQSSLAHDPYETQATQTRAKGAALGILGGAGLGSAALIVVWLLVGSSQAFVAPGLPLDYTIVAGVFFFSIMGMLIGLWTGAPGQKEVQP